MRRSLGVMLALVLLLAAGLALAPAAWLDRPLAQRTQGRLRLEDARGFWWHGGGTLVTADGAARIPFGWRVALRPLFRRTLAISVEADGEQRSGELFVRNDGIEARDLALRVPAALVAAFSPRSQPLAWGGEIALRAPAVHWRDAHATGGLTATWQRARVVAGLLAIDLGTVSVAAAPAGDALTGTIRNIGGEVAIDGTINDRAGVTEVAFTVKPTNDTPAAVRQMLPLLGAADGAGGVRVAWRSAR